MFSSLVLVFWFVQLCNLNQLKIRGKLFISSQIEIDSTLETCEADQTFESVDKIVEILVVTIQIIAIDKYIPLHCLIFPFSPRENLRKIG